MKTIFLLIALCSGGLAFADSPGDEEIKTYESSTREQAEQQNDEGRELASRLLMERDLIPTMEAAVDLVVESLQDEPLTAESCDRDFELWDDAAFEGLFQKLCAGIPGGGTTYGSKKRIQVSPN